MTIPTPSPEHPPGAPTPEARSAGVPWGIRIAWSFVEALLFLFFFVLGSIAWYFVLGILALGLALPPPVAVLTCGGLMLFGNIVLVRRVVRQRRLERETGVTPGGLPEAAVLGLAFSPLVYGLCFGFEVAFL